MKIIDGIRFNDPDGTVTFNFYSWVELLKAIIVKYENKTETEAEALVLTSPIVSNPISDYMSAALRSHESEYHWAMLITHGEGYWKNGIDHNEPEGYIEWEKEYRDKHGLAEDSFIFDD